MINFAIGVPFIWNFLQFSVFILKYIYIYLDLVRSANSLFSVKNTFYESNFELQ